MALYVKIMYMKNPKFKKYLVFGSLITTTLVIAPLVTLSCKSNNKQNKNAKES
jgi:hypothetical protein